MTFSDVIKGEECDGSLRGNDLMILDLYGRNASLYDWLMNRARYAPTVKAIISTLLEDVVPNARILDLGCGTGLAMEALVRRFPKSNITGLDCSRQMLAICQRKYPGTNLLLGNFNNSRQFCSFNGGKEVCLPNASFDVVISAGAVSEYGSLDTAVPLIHSLIKSDGMFINIGIRRNLLNRLSGVIWGFRPKGPKEFMAACRQSGFAETARVPIPWRLFPTNILKYVVRATK